MKLKSTSLRSNFLNLCAVLGFLILITACVCQSDRDKNTSDPKTTPTPSNDTKTETNSNKTTTGKNEDKGDFIVEHIPVKNPRYNEIDRQIKEDKLMEKAADSLNRSLILPYDIDLRSQDCGEPNAYYDPNDHSVTVCYELMEHFYNLYRSEGMEDQKAYDKMFDAVRFAFLHEIGHALIDTYKLPVMGNEEDAADRCSSFINLEELGEDGVKAVLAAADAFAIESKMTQKTNRNMADEHLLQEQRFYNSLCMIYGSNQSKYAYIVDEGYLPEARAVRCPSEYERTVQSWKDLLKDWRKK